MKKIIIAIFSSLCVVFFASHIFAKNINNGITISPIISKITLNKGETYSGDIYLTNNSPTTKTVALSIDAFRQQGDTNHPKFSSKINSISQAIHWIKIQQNVLLYPNILKMIPYTVNVPLNASPGGHFISIMASEGGGKNTKIVQSVGSLIMMIINGKITSTGFINSFSTSNNFYLKNPINFDLKFSNTGNVYYAPFGFITIKNIFGNTISTIEINKNKSDILPESTRLYVTQLKMQNILNEIGIYSATLNLTYGYQGHYVNTVSKTTFYMIDYKYILLILILVFLVYIIKKHVTIKHKSTSKRNSKQ